MSGLYLVGLIVGQLLLVEIHLMLLVVVVLEVAGVVRQLGARYEVGVVVALEVVKCNGIIFERDLE